MRYTLIVTALIVACGLVSVTAEEEPASDLADTTEIELTTLEQRASYALGYGMGRQFKDDVFEVDVDQLMRGFTDGMNGRETPLTEKQLRRAVQQMSEQIQSKVLQRKKDKVRTYLEDNAKRDGVKVTESGLQYEVLSKGDGDRPAAQDRVKVHYRGTLTSGKVFDSSYKRGKPATFAVSGVIPGWTEGLQLMRQGAKYRFHIPPKLGYGERGTRDGAIGPYEALIFEVELLEVIDANQP